MGKRQTADTLTIIALITSIIVAILSPTIPPLSKEIILMILITIGVLLIILLLIMAYLGMSKRIEKAENENNKLINNNEKIKEELTFLKENFKTMKDLSDMKARVKIMEKRIFKK